MVKNFLSRRLLYSIIIFFLILLLVVGYYKREDLVRNTDNWLSKQTIPFNLLVNQKLVNKSKRPRQMALNEISEQIYDEKLHNIDTIVGQFDRSNQTCGFLNASQNQQLRSWVQKKPHRYLFSVTPVILGADTKGDFVVVSANRYDDTKNIVSYRYKVYFKKQKVVRSQFIGKFKNEKPPKFISWTDSLGESGISKTPNFIEKMNSVLVNSGIVNKPDTTIDDYEQLGNNLGLKSGSGSALEHYAKNGGSDQNNSSIVTYEFSDVPRETKFLLKQLYNDHVYYYTLTYNRNQNNFTKMQIGKKLVSSMR